MVPMFLVVDGCFWWVVWSEMVDFQALRPEISSMYPLDWMIDSFEWD